jgi:GTP-binding protein
VRGIGRSPGQASPNGLKVRAAFVTSAAGPEGCPADGLPELALVGRSNVGKSMLVNALARSKLARTSAAPGKTRLLNVYRLDPEGDRPFHLVDLPGYGYARGGQTSVEAFELLTRRYFADRTGQASAGRRTPEAFAVLQLVDGRHPGLVSDLGAHDWLMTLGVPLGVVATKFDKLTRAERSRAQQAFERAFTSPVLPVSAATGEGLNELWTLIRRLLSSRRQPSPKNLRSSTSPR